MDKQKDNVHGISATAPQPDWRGFLTMALVLSGPFMAVVFGIEFAVRWGL